ncbi:MAG: hypothetical protein HUU28_01735 [Planctomycetaceae bacterium]|nr:hypothetical protein [Planctomycetaceae bacterium]
MKTHPPRFTRALDGATDPDHHLWLNGKVWWIAFTYHTADGRKRRLRASLGTHDVQVARRSRDELLDSFERDFGHRPSLRFAAAAEQDRGKAA